MDNRIVLHGTNSNDSMVKNAMTINFIGNFAKGFVGEIADEVMLARELERAGHTVIRVPRDVWKAYVDGDKVNEDWILPVVADANIICKWDHFNNQFYAQHLKKVSKAPVLYWTWDFMDYNEDGFHYKMASGADLLLTNDGMGRVPGEIKWRYFPFDVADGDLPVQEFWTKKYNVTFFGSYLQQGDRIEWLTEINKIHPVRVFSWNHQEWQKAGFDAHPAVYGEDFCRELAQSEITLGFNVNDYTWGYWSNRVGKVLSQGGLLLQRYVPGMELFLRDGADYFNSIDEACEKIQFYLDNEDARNRQRMRAFEVGRERFTAKARVRDLLQLIGGAIK